MTEVFLATVDLLLLCSFGNLLHELDYHICPKILSFLLEPFGDTLRSCDASSFPTVFSILL